MAGARLDVVGIGNALVDVLSYETPEFVAAEGLTRGAMMLIDAERAVQLYAAMGPAVEISGGSAANTLVGLTSLGGHAQMVRPLIAPMAERDGNSPAIVIWGLYNEEWGLDWDIPGDPAKQEAAARAYDLLKPPL